MAQLGWHAGREEDVAEDEDDIKLMVVYGVAWPVMLVCFVVGMCALALGHWSRRWR